MAAATVTVYVSIAAILVPLIVKYFNDLHMAGRNARLIRVTEQLNGFYGPLLALTSASNKNWDYFRSRYRAGGGAYWSQNPPPTGAEAEAWRRWMSTVFMPLNRKMRDVIVGGVHLLEEDQVPGHLLTLCAHVSAYEAIIASWEEGNYSDNKPSIPFPREDLRIYANNSYIKLKNRQSKLLSQNGLIGALIWMMRRVPLHPRAH